MENNTSNLTIGRIYHPYYLWEDFKHGFYDNSSGEVKQKHIDKVLEMFNDKHLTITYMNKVIDTWVYSCEHNLTNNSMNRIAYIGQAACCLYSQIPSTITMEAWSLLDDNIKEQANKIANEVLSKWEKKNNNLQLQLCLNLD